MAFETKEEVQAWIRKIMGPPKRILHGEEHEKVWLMLQMSEPVRETNSQRSFCVEYNLGRKMYDVHYLPGEEPFIEEYLDEPTL